nr:MAG TPA: Neck appendage protein [Caudoviricetes sp.]
MQLHFNSTYIDVLPTDESYRYHSIMGEHTLNLYFALPTYTDIPTGAWCEFQGERYTLNQPAKVVKHNSRHFEYTLTMDSEGANLKNYKFRNPNDKTLKFPFTASPRYHIQILVDCLNMIDSGWQVGTTIEANEKLISYNHNNCLEALDMIAKAFETEYEIIGKTIHLHKVEYFKDNPLPLQYGKGKGFKTGVSRTTEQSRITRLYVQGGERNIDRSKYGNKELLLPKSQEYVYEGVTFVSDDKGLSITIKNAQNNGFINEQSLDLSHIYPSRKGTISAVFEVDRDKHFYDFADTTIPEALNFADLQIKGEKMVIYFESGMLSGREFEVSKYDHAQKRFQLVPKEEDGTTMPNDIFKPAIGDQYSVYNMHLPAAYICDNDTKMGASWEMMKEACKYLYENKADLFTFTGDLDGIWAKRRWVNVGGRLKMGGYINFSDTEFQRTPVAIRIVGLKEYVNNPYSPQIELSNKVQGQSFSSEIRKLQNQEVYFGEMNKHTQSLTKRSWRNALETIKQVEEAFPEYTKSIIPATVQTMMALVGNKSGQFAFVANKTNPITVPHTLYFDRNNKQINAGSGWIKHYTLGTTDIKPSHSAADYKYWYVSQFVSGRLDDKAKSYYLYIKANKAIETAEFVLSETKIGMEQEAGFYHFLYATVNSEYDGERGIAQFNGFTEITGGQMVTNRIASGNGQQFIALYDDRIEINAHLQISESNKLEFKQLVNPDLQSLESRLKQYSNEQMGNIQVGGRNFVLNSKEKRTMNGYTGTFYLLLEPVKPNEQYVFSCNTQANGGMAAYFSDTYGGVRQYINNVLQNGKNNILVTPNRAWKGITIFHEVNGVIPPPISSIELVKLEKGNKPTDWTPAPEDIENKIDNEKQIREQTIANAKSATEAYARAQADLLKLQAIAEANRRAGIALTAEQQARILQLQLNLQQAKTFAQQKVNELDIGGRNLILNSKNERYKEYRGMVEDYIYYDIVGGTLEKNTTYTLSLEYKSENVRSVEMFFINENTSFVRNRDIPNTNGEWRREIMTFTTDPNLTPRGHIRIDNNGSDLGNVTSKLWVRNIKLERGNKPTDWSPAPEDVENQIANINSDLETIRQNAARIEDLENKNKAKTDERIGKLDQKTAFLNDTQIAGNVVATGTMIVGNTTGTQAGITGVGNATNEVRFWAGSEFGGRYAAPYRVLQDGSLYASKGQIGNFKIESASDTSLIANGLTVASNGIIKAFGSATNRSTQVIINDPGQLQELVGTRPVASIYSSGFEDTSHTALHLTSRGGHYNTALVLESENGASGSVAIDIRKGDVYVKGQKGYTGWHVINTTFGYVKMYITDGIITNVEYV